MFLRLCSPRSANVTCSLSRTCRYASSERQIAPGWQTAFQPGGNVDAVAHQIAVALLDDVAEMDADAELDALLGR